MQKIYISIDLKSFYASVECRERGLNPLTTNLVVADSSRTEKTVCLAVSPSLKQYGIPGRARLFEVVQKVREVNIERKYKTIGHVFNGKSYDDIELKKYSEYELDYIVATPQMKKYMKYSTDIYNVYSKVYKLTSIITIDLKNITDEEFRTLSVERAKELLQAQATKITAIEKYFTEAEKNWAQSNYGIKYEKDKEAELSNYFTNKMKELEEEVNINSYKAELTKLRKFDAYVSY